jgi:CBS domain-containing protein
MSLLQCCDECAATVGLSASVEDAIRTMIDKTVGAVAVIDDQGVVAGMFTERDVLSKFALSGRDPVNTPVREMMSPMVEMATEETTPTEALQVMVERHYRHMPIVDEQGKVLGICSIRNILQARIDDLLTRLDSSAK